jgi:bifunctional non-homologous end joining protein LigD
MAALPVQRLPTGGWWLYELKFDGYRVQIVKDGTAVRLISRNQKDLTRSYPSIVAQGKKVSADQAVIDGELVALDANSKPSFQALQHRGRCAEHRIAFYAFDLLHKDGRELLQEPLDTRRSLLPKIIEESGLLLSEPLPGPPEDIIRAVRSLGLEGVVAKRRSSLYQPGERSGDWVKLRLDLAQEFVVGGYRPGSNGVDALLVGVYAGKLLRFSGKVSAGFIPHTRRDLVSALKPLHTDKCPFPELPDTKPSRWGGGVTAEDMKEMQWVLPSLVVQIRFLEWTADERLRHATYLGRRPDKAAKDVRRE